jgi:peptidoglycan/LPS O-acetylase OafA/YrhL
VKSPPSCSELTAHADDLVPNLPPSENKRFYPALDGLRAIAVLLVFCQHYIFHPSALRWGWVGVDIFFVLSGFLITGILYDTRETAHRFRNFYVRRTLRIFPLYYGVLLLALLLTPLLHWTWHPAWYLWASYLGNYARFIYINDFISTGHDIVEDLLSKLPFAYPLMLHMGHFWSLCVEEQFYLFWPLVVFLVKDRVRLRNLCIAIVLVEPFLRLICAATVPLTLVYYEFLDRFTPLRIDALLLGGLVALCLRGPESNFVARLGRPVVLTIAASFVAMEAITLLFTHTLAEPEANITWISTFGFSAVDLLGAGMILLAIDPRTSFYRILNRPYLRRLGQMSYGFYVFHNIPHWFYDQIAVRVFKAGSNAEQILAATIAFVCTLIVSYLSFRFFESPFLRLKERFTAS